MAMACVLVSMVISLAPLYNMKAQIQRDLDHATRAAAVQIDLQMLSRGQIVFNEAAVEAAFDLHFNQYEVIERQLDLDLINSVLTSTATVRIPFHPWFYGSAQDIDIPRTSSVQIFLMDGWQE